jgi:small multidrug resistance pump
MLGSVSEGSGRISKPRRCLENSQGGTKMQSWIILSVAILLEVAGTNCMKLSQGFSRLIPSVLIFVFYGLSFVGLTIVLKKIDVSIAYAVWAGIGTALIAFIGIFYFKEPLTLVKVFSILLIIAGVVGLNLGGVKL